ncbi:MAG: hypothetical protein ABJD97_09290, partial [Betaproteobacteria bacterium]
IKETSLGYIIGLTEVSFISSQINTQVFTKAPQVYLLLGLTYFTLCFGLSRFALWLERRLGRRAAAHLPTPASAALSVEPTANPTA